eukprot:scaffold1499_cov255-Pinguiococcus_pyrenoidosus.AAC.38
MPFSCEAQGRLAHQGLRLSRAHCGPSRASSRPNVLELSSFSGLPRGRAGAPCHLYAFLSTIRLSSLL